MAQSATAPADNQPPTLEDIAKRLTALEKEVATLKAGQTGSNAASSSDNSQGASMAAKTEPAAANTDTQKMAPGWAATVLIPSKDRDKPDVPAASFVLEESSLLFKDHQKWSGLPTNFSPIYDLEGYFKATEEGNYFFSVQADELPFTAPDCQIDWKIEGNEIIHASGQYITQLFEAGQAELSPGLYKMRVLVGCEATNSDTSFKLLVKTPSENAPAPIAAKSILHKVK